MKYRINEIFASIQGEGVHAGRPVTFIRFADCNLRCRQEPHGFDCDTEFASYRLMTGDEIASAVDDLGLVRVVLTGGEPALQADRPLVSLLRDRKHWVAIETNGTRNVDDLMLDWVCVSPKTAEHTLRQLHASEVKYVRAVGQPIPRPCVTAKHKLISPACHPEGYRSEDIQWCLDLVHDYPSWRLSLQLHKLIGVR